MKTIFFFFSIISPFVLLAASDSVDCVIKAEAEYGLYDSVLSKRFETQSPEVFLCVAQAFSATGSADSALAWAKKTNSLPEAFLQMSFIYAQTQQTDSSCWYLKEYLATGNCRPRSEIILDVRFRQMSNETCWKSIWKLDWYADDEESSFQSLLYRKQYDQLLSNVYAQPERIQREYVNSIAKALIGLGQLKDAQAALRNVVDTASIRLRWNVEMQLGKYRDAFETANEYARKTAFAKAEKMVAISAFYADEIAEANEAITQYLTVYYMDAEGLALAGAIALADNRLLDCYRYTNTALRFDGNCAEARRVRGDAFIAQENWVFAQKEFLLYLDLVGNDAEVLVQLGFAYVMQGEKGKGCHELKRAFALHAHGASDYLLKYCAK